MDPHPALDAFPDLVGVRLYDAAGAATENPYRPALDAFRLVDEAEPAGASPLRLFEAVPGVALTIRGAVPGDRVAASVPLVSPSGAGAEWRTFARADAAGVARLRLPYATGRNGRITAREWSVRSGERRATLAVSDAQVLDGAAVELALAR
jgi:hypothetical protein